MEGGAMLNDSQIPHHRPLPKRYAYQEGGKALQFCTYRAPAATNRIYRLSVRQAPASTKPLRPASWGFDPATDRYFSLPSAQLGAGVQDNGR